MSQAFGKRTVGSVPQQRNHIMPGGPSSAVSVSAPVPAAGMKGKAIGWAVFMLVFFVLLALHTLDPNVFYEAMSVAPRPLVVIDMLLDNTLVVALGRPVTAVVLAAFGVFCAFRIHRNIISGRVIPG